jgi:hypothetical protein
MLMNSNKNQFVLCLTFFVFCTAINPVNAQKVMKPESLDIGDSYDLPQATRIVQVHDNGDLEKAISGMQQGDRIVLHNGEYQGINIENKNVGTNNSPVVIIAKNPRKAIIHGSTYGRNLRLSNCSQIHFYGIRFTEGKTWGITVGPAYADDSLTRGCHHLLFRDCEIDNARQELLKISGNSSFIRVIGNELHHSGNGLKGDPYAEGIYVGCGATKDDRSHDILIQGNHIHHIGRAKNPGYGEGIDIKVQTWNITVVDNLLEHITVHSQAAITVHADNVDFPQEKRNPNILVSRNRIHDIRKCDDGWDGAGIWVSSNGVVVSNNVIWDTSESSIVAKKDVSNTKDSLRIYHNTCFSVVDGEKACFSVNSDGIYGSSPVNPVILNNISDDGSAGQGNYTATDRDFEGPVAGDADSGAGIASGFRLDNSSDAVDHGTFVDRISYDLSGTKRPQGSDYDMGAFEIKRD